MKKQLFTIDGFNHPHIGYTAGNRWNGWATPFFEVDEAIKIMEEFNSYEPEEPIIYAEANDTFMHKIADDEIELWKGTNYNTDEGIKHLYGIGAYAWIWDTVTQDEIYVIAQTINDFLWNYDTYEYKDQYEDYDHITEKIAKQLQDLNTLKQVIIALYAEKLTEQELAEKLGKELRI